MRAIMAAWRGSCQAKRIASLTVFDAEANGPQGKRADLGAVRSQGLSQAHPGGASARALPSHAPRIPWRPPPGIVAPHRSRRIGPPAGFSSITRFPHRLRQHPEEYGEHAPERKNVSCEHLEHFAGPKTKHPLAEERSALRRPVAHHHDGGVHGQQCAQSENARFHQKGEIHIVGDDRLSEVLRIRQRLVPDSGQGLPGMVA